MVNWWLGARWFGFLGSSYAKNCYLGVPLESRNHQPKPLIFHYLKPPTSFVSPPFPTFSHFFKSQASGLRCSWTWSCRLVLPKWTCYRRPQTIANQVRMRLEWIMFSLFSGPYQCTPLVNWLAKVGDLLYYYFSEYSWMYPDQRTPVGNPYISPIACGYL